MNTPLPPTHERAEALKGLLKAERDVHKQRRLQALCVLQTRQARPRPAGGPCDIGAYEVEAAGQPLGAWVTGLTPNIAVCTNGTTGQQVTLSAHAPACDCEAAGLGVTAGDRVSLLVRGHVVRGATDVSGAVTGMTPSSGGCTNLTTGQAVAFQHLGTSLAELGRRGLLDPASHAGRLYSWVYRP